MFSKGKNKLGLMMICVMAVWLAAFATVVRAQETGGDLIGGAGIFRPKNPEARHSTKTTRPRPTLTPAELEEKFQDAISDGNDARDARKFADAEASYRAALKLKPRDTRAFQGLGNVFVDQQRWEDAEDAYRKAVEFSPTNPEALLALSFVLVQPRTGAVNARRFTDAEQFARRAAQLAPNSSVAFDRLGVAMSVRGIVNSETESALRHAVELDPNNVVAQVHLARVLKRLNRASEADPIYQSAIAKAQQDAPTLVLIADSMQAEQQWADSEPVLRRALQLDARHPGALYLLGRFLSVNRKYGEAEAILRQAIEVNPRFFQARYILARCYLALDRFDDAFKTYDEAAKLASDADRKQLAGSFGFMGVGDGFMKLNRASDAVRAYERGLQIDPANTELQAKLAAARAKITG